MNLSRQRWRREMNWPTAYKASNLAVYSEIGRYPLFIDQIVHTIKYRNYILDETKNTLIKEFFDEMTKLPGKTTNLHTFFNTII